MSGLWTVGLDADDTLWHNERYFMDATEMFIAMIRRYVDLPDLEERLAYVERQNLELFGYGVKGYTLSLIETAIEVTGARVSAADVQMCLDWGKAILAQPVELLDGVVEAVESLAEHHRVIVITKGDLLHQETKVAGSGLAERFAAVEVVNEKDPSTYRRILAKHHVDAARFVMVGNSVKSDVLPVLAIGAKAVHIPYETTWAHEQVAQHDEDFPVLDSIAELPALVQQFAALS
jgi:putative hydrolase of the HAD superfamily